MSAWVEVDLGPGVLAGFTTAEAGNLSLVVGDRVTARSARAWLAAQVGGPLTWPVQVHGARVAVVGPEDDDVGEADAVVTSGDRGLAVLVADCVPVLLASHDGAVVSAVHAGRRGVAAGVVAAAVQAMVEQGARPEAVRAVIGPAVCGRCYEVPAPLAAEVEAIVPGSRSTTSWGTVSLDLPRAVATQLRAAGVGEVDDLHRCTLTDTRFFSHRGHLADGRVEGRTAAVVRRVHGVSALWGESAGLA